MSIIKRGAKVDVELEGMVRELWNQFVPGKTQNNRFYELLGALKLKYRFIGDYLFAEIPSDQKNEMLISLIGDYNRLNDGVFSNHERSLAAQNVYFALVNNVRWPRDYVGPKQFRGFWLAREVSEDGTKGVELFVLDKGRGFKLGGQVIILSALEPGWSTTDGGYGLSLSRGVSDTLEIESAGYLWRADKIDNSPIPINTCMKDVPFIQGAKVRAVIYDCDPRNYKDKGPTPFL